MDLTATLLGMHSEDEARSQYLRAPMGWPGAKTRSLKQLLPHLPYRNTWIDVCGGTAAVTLARNPCRLEVYNDRHSGIVTFYRCIRDRVKCKQLQDRLELSPGLSREEFMWSKETWNDCQDDVERAARWYYSVATSFNQKGWSFGRTTTGRGQASTLFNKFKLFGSLHVRMQNVHVENQDWRMILKDHAPGGEEVVWYIDPPYWRTTGSYEHEWTEEDHFELCERVQGLNGGYVAVSGYDHPDHPYNKFKFWTKKIKWKIAEKAVSQAFTEANNLAAHADTIKRGVVEETLWVYDP